MRKIQKSFALLIVLLMCISCIAGCTGGTTSGDTGTAAGTSAAPAEKTISFTVKPQNDGPQDPNSPVTKLIEEKFNVKIEYVYLDRVKETELLNLRLASGDIPDVMLLNDVNLPILREQGALANIPLAKVKSVMPVFYDLTTKNAAGAKVWDMYSEDADNLFALPSLSVGAKYSLVPIWRDDWLKNVGINKIPETMEEAEEAFYRFVRNDPDQNGKDDTYAFSQRGMWGVFGAYGGFPYFFFWKTVDDGIVFDATRLQMKEAVVKLAQYYEDGLIDPEFITGENKGQSYYNSPPFWNGTIGYTVAGTWGTACPPLYEGHLGSTNYQSFKSMQGEDATYAEGKPLEGPGGMGLFKWTLLTGYGVGFGKQVSGDPAKMEKIMSILEAYNSDEETYLLITGGIKGETYYLDYGCIRYPEELQKNQEKGRAYAYAANGMGILCNNFDMYNKYNMRQEVIDYNDRVAAYTFNWENALIGALPSSGEYKATVEKKVEEAFQLFITGKKNMDEWDSFVADLDQSGLNVLTKEANDWYAKYFK